MYELFARFVDAPELALIPAASFALLAVFFRQRALWLVAGLWALYTAYEAGVAAGVLCSGDCAIRVDLLLIAPATANLLGKLAHGTADDFLTTTYLATKAPVIVALLGASITFAPS